MKFLKLFSGKTPEAHEQKGDALFDEEAYGPAKIEYERALSKLAKKGVDDVSYRAQIEEKRTRSMEALALAHKAHGEALLEGRNFSEAEEIFTLALELSKDPELIEAVNEKLRQTARRNLEVEKAPSSGMGGAPKEDVASVPQGGDEEYFRALLESLSEEEKAAYRGYGEAFKEGWLALNQGDFRTAADKLETAMADHTAESTHIPLELATALLNLGEIQEARLLLEAYLEDQNGSLRAHQLMCEILWENSEFQEAWQLLLSCRPPLSDSLNVHLLKGETLFQAGKIHEAESFYLEYLNTVGWNEYIAQSLAKTYEALGLYENARDLYGEVISACQGCGRRIDSNVKKRYADVSLETGQLSTKLLDIYFGLVQEDPGNRVDYYQKISRIYTLQGNRKEAGRYQAMADEAKTVQPG